MKSTARADYLREVIADEPARTKRVKAKDYRGYLKSRGYKRVIIERTEKVPGTYEFVGGKLVEVKGHV